MEKITEFISIVYIIPACLFIAIVYSIPVIFIQSFLGQFSSSGFISVFRIAPLFKGLGYIGLAINLTSLAYYSVYAAVPLILFFHSLQRTLPWSCEGAKDWLLTSTNESEALITHCNLNHTELEDHFYLLLSVPSVEYFANLVDTSFSFSLFGCVLLIWIGVAFVLFNTTEKIGCIFRYCVVILVTFLLIIYFRALFLPGVMESLSSKFFSTEIRWELWILFIPLLASSSFGPGWGTVLSMASYNTFKTNITKFSWLISQFQLGIMLLMGYLCMFTESHLTQNNDRIRTSIFDMQWPAFLSIPSTLATMEYPHLWTWMFFAILIIGSFNLVVVQMFSVLTALFDEYEKLRPFRREVIFGTSGILALVSALFCTSDGIYSIEILANLSVITQSTMNAILLIVVLWIYGRERFQRDVQFMTSQVIATWKVYLLRFVTPLFVLLTLLFGIAMYMLPYNPPEHLIPIAEALAYLPWLVLPGYCIFKMMQTNGTIGLRFKRGTRPTDWFPVDPDDRLRYEETMDNPEISHPLTEIVP